MAKASRRTAVSCAIFSIRDSTPTKTEESRWMVFLRTSPERGAASFNYRFAQPSRDAQPTSSVFFPTDIFPFTDQPEKDPVTGRADGLLDRAIADKVVPKIFFSNTSYEYWGRAAALIHISADGTTGRADFGQRSHLSLHRAATFLRAVSAGKRRRRSAGPATAIAAPDPDTSGER